MQNKSIIELRRDLHRIPELHFSLPKTREYLTGFLKELDCELVDLGEPGFLALFNMSKTGETMAFRTDMDALPIEEINDVPYKSEHTGQMHACGHDGHMAIILAFARKIHENLTKINQGVVLIFQAAEETTGGASLICKSGIFKKYNITKVYGLHLWPNVEAGAIAIRKGEFMAGTNVLNIQIQGRASHIANYKMGIDALRAASDFVQNVYKMETEELDPSIYRLLKFGMLKAGTGVNIVASEASLGGTLRTYSKQVKDFLFDRMHKIASDIEAKTGTKIKIEASEGYPPLINPSELFSDFVEKMQKLHTNLIILEDPLLVSEDFSYYQLETPGLFFHLGTGSDTPLHTNNYYLNEEVLERGVEIFWELLV
jgi:hippurate hydrolase